MSNYWYYECLDHPGGLISEDEFTQHTSDRYYDRGLQLVIERPVESDNRYWGIGPYISDTERSDLYFSMQARAFLHQHPTCRLGIIDEYGERRPVPGQEPSDNAVRELIEAAVTEITPNVQGETHAWNLWNALNTSRAFIAAFEEMRRRART